MKPSPEIQNELASIAPQLPAGVDTPYRAPEGYFDSFALRMLEQVSPMAQQASVPAGYFESFADTMLAKVRQAEVAEELSSMAPTLAGISRRMPYYLPEDYFTQSLPQPWLQQEAGTPVRRLGSRRWLQIAAAVVVLLAAAALWRSSSHAPATPADYSQPELALIADTLPVPADISQQLAGIDLAALNEAYEISTPASSTGTATATDNLTAESLLISTDNFEAALQNFSASDLQEHLSTLPAATTE